MYAEPSSPLPGPIYKLYIYIYIYIASAYRPLYSIEDPRLVLHVVCCCDRRQSLSGGGYGRVIAPDPKARPAARHSSEIRTRSRRPVSWRGVGRRGVARRGVLGPNRHIGARRAPRQCRRVATHLHAPLRSLALSKRSRPLHPVNTCRPKLSCPACEVGSTTRADCHIAPRRAANLHNAAPRFQEPHLHAIGRPCAAPRHATPRRIAVHPSRRQLNIYECRVECTLVASLLQSLVARPPG